METRLGWINSIPVTRLSWALRSIAGSIDTRLSWALRSIAGTIDTRLFWALRPYIGSIVNALDWAPSRETGGDQESDLFAHSILDAIKEEELSYPMV